jgi:hypothetical protein
MQRTPRTQQETKRIGEIIERVCVGGYGEPDVDIDVDQVEEKAVRDTGMPSSRRIQPRDGTTMFFFMLWDGCVRI